MVKVRHEENRGRVRHPPDVSIWVAVSFGTAIYCSREVLRMNATDWFVILEGIGSLLLLWQQNQIFKKQNEIFAAQAGMSIMESESPSRVALRRYWPMLTMALLMVFTWTGVVVGYYNRDNSLPDIPEFDEPQNGLFNSYGPSNLGCDIDANGNRFWDYRDKYRIAAACIIFDREHNLLDTPSLQVGQEHDITRGHIFMRADVSDNLKPLINKHGVTFLILLVPIGVTTSQFTTLRTARSLGVKIKLAGSK